MGSLCGDNNTTTTTSVQLPPELMSQLGPLWTRAGKQAQQDYQTYDGQRIAGFNQDQSSAFNMIRQDAGLGPANYTFTGGRADGPRFPIDQLRPGAAQSGTGGSSAGAGGPAPPVEQDGQFSAGGPWGGDTDGNGNPLPSGPVNRSWMPNMGAGTLADVAGYQPNQATATNASAAGLGPAAAMSAAQMSAAQATGAVAQRGNIRDVQAGSLPQVDLSGYTNPFTEGVVNTSLADLAHQNDILNNQTNARAASEGAFGGSRSAVMNSLNNEAFMRQAGQLSAGLRSQGFTQAQNTAETDIERQMRANLANQGVDLSTTNLNAQLGEQTNLTNAQLTQQAGMTNAQLAQQAAAANQGATNNFALTQAQLQQQANLTNAGAANQMTLANQNAGLAAAGLRLNAGNSQAANALQQQQYGTNVENRLAGIGTQEQGLQQQNLNLAYQDFLNQQNWPWTQMAQESAILRGTPMPTTTTQTAPGPSLFSQLAGLGLSGYGLGLFGRRDGGAVPGGIAGDALNGLVMDPSLTIDAAGAIDPTAGIGFVPVGDGSWMLADGTGSLGGDGSASLFDDGASAIGLAGQSPGLNRSALLAAGLGMMASRAPNALTAIGEGGLMGLRALGSSQRGGLSPFVGSRMPYAPWRRYGGIGAFGYDEGGIVGASDAALPGSPWPGSDGSLPFPFLDDGYHASDNADPWQDGRTPGEQLADLFHAYPPPDRARAADSTAPDDDSTSAAASGLDLGNGTDAFWKGSMPSWLGEPGTIGERFDAIDDAFGRLPMPGSADELPGPLAPRRAPAFDGWTDGDPRRWLYDERSNGDSLSGLGPSSDYLLPVANPFFGRSTAAEDDRSEQSQETEQAIGGALEAPAGPDDRVSDRYQAYDASNAGAASNAGLGWFANKAGSILGAITPDFGNASKAGLAAYADFLEGRDAEGRPYADMPLMSLTEPSRIGGVASFMTPFLLPPVARAAWEASRRGGRTDNPSAAVGEGQATARADAAEAQAAVAARDSIVPEGDTQRQGSKPEPAPSTIDVAPGTRLPGSMLPQFVREVVVPTPKGEPVPNPQFVLGELPESDVEKIARYSGAETPSSGELRVSGRALKHTHERHGEELGQDLERIGDITLGPHEVLPNPANLRRAWIVAPGDEKSSYVSIVEVAATKDGLEVVNFFKRENTKLGPAKTMAAAIDEEHGALEGRNLPDEAVRTPSSKPPAETGSRPPIDQPRD